MPQNSFLVDDWGGIALVFVFYRDISASLLNASQRSLVADLMAGKPKRPGNVPQRTLALDRVAALEASGVPRQNAAFLQQVHRKSL
jgi:hypothetical protein